jgi:hypothetical protein
MYIYTQNPKTAIVGIELQRYPFCINQCQRKVFFSLPRSFSYLFSYKWRDWSNVYTYIYIYIYKSFPSDELTRWYQHFKLPIHTYYILRTLKTFVYVRPCSSKIRDNTSETYIYIFTHYLPPRLIKPIYPQLFHTQ